ncbi:hypothetical protein BN2476_670098 [Paraburkholderia piptadeniae]|uniref:Uncharacterized protein n=1 Tax=Paraburkholderia piptadeniae TaxID=1701573 RepID=A0A1N7SNV9_9BURK|nr:hypothetical protein BN2476_670098 [Paraburkholderia piptadeniae]
MENPQWARVPAQGYFFNRSKLLNCFGIDSGNNNNNHRSHVHEIALLYTEQFTRPDR